MITFLTMLTAAICVVSGSPTTSQNDPREKIAIEGIERLGGKVFREQQASGVPIVRVTFAWSRAVRLESRFGDRDVSLLADIGNLTDLTLTGTNVTDVGLKKVGLLKGLARLDLRDCKIGDSGVNNLAELKKLAYLNVCGTQISDASMTSIARLSNLRELEIDSTGVTDRGLQSVDLSGLTLFYLGHTRISDVGLEKVGLLQRLEYLDLSSLRITDNGVTHLSQLKQLKRLYLRDTGISDNAIGTIATLINLESLDLRDTDVTNKALRELGSLKKLTWLGVPAGRIAKSTQLQLQALLPHVHIVSE
jgi:internalin A